MDNIPQDDTPRKQCNGHCKQTFPATAEFFSRDKTRRDGLQVLCKKCMSLYKREHYQRNKEKINKKQKDYREANKETLADWHKRYYLENKNSISAKRKAYQEKNKDKISASKKRYYRDNVEWMIARQKKYYQEGRRQVYLKEYYATHKEERKAYLRAYFQTERGRMVERAHSHKRRARKLVVGGSYTADQLQDQLKRQKHKCYWCGTKLGKGRRAWHADHLVPLSRENTSNEIGNIVIACPDCNMQRHNKLPHEWPEGGRLL